MTSSLKDPGDPRPGGRHTVSAAIRRASPNPSIEALRSRQPLRQALWVLREAADAGVTGLLGLADIQEALEDFEVAVSRTQLSRALSRAGSKVIRRAHNRGSAYKIALPGREYLSVRPEGVVEVVVVEAGHKYSARRTVRDLGSDLGGSLSIVDKYYGVRSLDIIEELGADGRRVRFLTSQTPERPGKVNRMIHELCQERLNIEVRLSSDPNTLHDRYVLGERALLIVGQGIKDLGGSESFVIRIGTDAGADMVALLRENFESRWNAALPVPKS